MAEYKKHQNIEHILSLAYMQEEGIVDYARLIEAIVPDLNETIRETVHRFSQRPYVIYFSEYAQRKNEGVSFAEILGCLENDSRFRNNVLDTAWLMMKIFELRLDEFFQQRAATHGAVSLSAAGRFELSNNIFDQVFADDEDI